MAERLAPTPEPISLAGGDAGVLCLHGFGGAPRTLGGIASALAQAGISVEAPVLPGHGETPEALEQVGWNEFATAAEEAYAELSARSRSISVLGFSSGATLAARLAVEHSEIVGLISVNGMFALPAGMTDEVHQTWRDGQRFWESPPPDCRNPDGVEWSYDRIPTRTVADMFSAVPAAVFERLGEVRCPVLAVVSAHDGGLPAPAESFEALRRDVNGPVEELHLAHSAHMAPIDLDREELEQAVVAFARRVAAGPLRR